MNALTRLLVLPIAVLLLSVASMPAVGEASANEFDIPLEGRHGITLHLGVLSQASVETDASAGGTSSDTRVNGFLGSLSYSYWAGSDWSIDIGAGGINAEASTSTTAGGVTSKSATVVPILFGATMYPSQMTLGSSARPYVSVAVGPYMGVATNSEVGTTIEEETVVESVLGGRVRAGLDVFVSKRFKLGAAVGYHFVSEFEEQIGSEKDHSGPEFVFAFGILLGKGK